MADKAKDFLAEWIIGFVKNKDLMLRNLESIEKCKDGSGVYAKFKDRERLFLIEPVIEDADELAGKLEEGKHYGIVTFNTMKSFKEVAAGWDKFAKFKDLTLYFVNPFSKTDKKWVVSPYVHNNICDKSTLERGLKAMFDMVEVLTEEEINAKLI